MKKIDFFQKKYPRFVYENFKYKIAGKNLKIVFNFIIEPKISPTEARPRRLPKAGGWREGCSLSAINFQPEIIIKNINKARLKKIGETALNNLIFNLGLIEIPSYWKATCSPEIIIKAGYLNKEQIKWWQDLIEKGMGQFFYENRINWKSKDFIKIKISPYTSKLLTKSAIADFRSRDRILVPVGGGKDSIVTLEILKKAKKELSSFSLNPTEAALKIIRIAGCKSSITVRRKIDEKLLELNRQGFLNGHTPFSAYLAFLSVLVAVLFDYKYIAFSNEKSANEGNVKYLGKMINHQWSKSSEFEKKFQNYCKKYLVKGVKYFSFLRKYIELEIVKMFTKYPKYFPVFSSCNVTAAKKMNKKWCGNCPKCLFIYATLYPFLRKGQLLKIFGRDIFENRELLPVMKGLIGKKTPKPFECVGTKKESRLVFELSLKKARKIGKTPYLLTKLIDKNKNEIR